MYSTKYSRRLASVLLAAAVVTLATNVDGKAAGKPPRQPSYTASVGGDVFGTATNLQYSYSIDETGKTYEQLSNNQASTFTITGDVAQEIFGTDSISISGSVNILVYTEANGVARAVLNFSWTTGKITYTLHLVGQEQIPGDVVTGDDLTAATITFSNVPYQLFKREKGNTTFVDGNSLMNVTIVTGKQ